MNVSLGGDGEGLVGPPCASFRRWGLSPANRRSVCSAYQLCKFGVQAKLFQPWRNLLPRPRAGLLSNLPPESAPSHSQINLDKILYEYDLKEMPNSQLLECL